MASVFGLDPPPGFRGLDVDLPVDFYRRHLPHWRQEGATYFVTFRLADSLPIGKLEELRVIRQQHSNDGVNIAIEDGEALYRVIFEKTERWLDQGMGSCVLRDIQFRRYIADALMFFDSERYQLSSYVVMPNHVHLLIRPTQGFDLATILQGCKRFAATKINEGQFRRGSLWQIESFDRIVRDTEHLWRCLQYIGKNPGKAGLQHEEYTRWVRPDWQALGWDFNSD